MSAPPDAPAPGSSTGGPSDNSWNLTKQPNLPKARGDAPTFWVLGLLVIALCVGLMFEAPGILVVLLVLATPALIRTSVASSRQQADGTSASGVTKLQTFISSLGVITMIGIASIAAFYATCFAVCLGGLFLEDLTHGKSYDWLVFASASAGLVPGLWVAVRLFRRHWPRKGQA